MAAGDIRLRYGAAVTLTITLDGLPTDAGRLTGRESTAVSNTTEQALDWLLAGDIVTGAANVDTVIEVWCWGAQDHLGKAPIQLTGVDAAATISSESAKLGMFSRLATIDSEGNNNEFLSWGPVSLVKLFGGCPSAFGVFVTHDTGANLGIQNVVIATPVYSNVEP